MHYTLYYYIPVAVCRLRLCAISLVVSQDCHHVESRKAVASALQASVPNQSNYQERGRQLLHRHPRLHLALPTNCLE